MSSNTMPAQGRLRTYPFGWLTEPIFDASQRDPSRLGAWLQADRRDWHYAGVVLALANDDQLDAIEPILFTAKRRDVLAKACPDADPRLLTLTGKLAGRLWSRSAYRRLAVLMNDPAAARLLTRAGRITRRQIAELARVPDDLRHQAVLARLRKSGDAERIVFAIRLVERIRTDLNRAAILRTLTQTPEKVSIEAWTRRHFRSASFPTPPWPGTAAVRPLRSWDEVHEIAKRFRNCLRSRAAYALDGSACLYVFRHDGKDRAVIELTRVAADHWVVCEAKGPNNDPLPPSVDSALRAELADLPRLPEGSWLSDLVDPDG